MENINNEDIKAFYNHKFDFDNQHKDTYDDWLDAFSKAIDERAEYGCFVGLSSGYDSGAITKELVKQNVRFKAYTIYNNEKKEVLDERLRYMLESQVTVMEKDTWQGYYDFLKGKINDTALADKASMGVANMFDSARTEGRRRCLSGQGADEILSDYSLFPKQSTLKGVYPEKLTEWPNFRGHMQEEYLNEIEDIAGIYGVEVKYPFLDVDLVQEFLWLKAELKNKNYKAPLFEYLTKNDVPFEKGVKRGFRPVK